MRIGPELFAMLVVFELVNILLAGVALAYARGNTRRCLQMKGPALYLAGQITFGFICLLIVLKSIAHLIYIIGFRPETLTTFY